MDRITLATLDTNTIHTHTATRKHIRTPDHEVMEVGRGDQQISHRTNTSQKSCVTHFQFWLSGNENEMMIILAPNFGVDRW